MMFLLAAILAAYVVAQACKIIVFWVRTGSPDWKVWFLPGGMPSAHSTLVTSLVAALYLREGFTPLVLAATVFAGIVMYDAMTLRREVSLHKMVIDRLHLKVENRHVKTWLKGDHIGHNPFEVILGIVIGIVVPILVSLLW